MKSEEGAEYMVARKVSDEAMIVARNIRFWRKERRLTLQQLAAALGNIEFSGIGEYERGQRFIPVDALMRIAKILNVEIGRFFEEPPAHHSGELTEVRQ